MITLLVIDMQAGSFLEPERKHDPGGVISRINELARAVRTAEGRVLFLQHDGPPGDCFAPGTEAWQLLDCLEREASDGVVHKTACDAFYRTGLAERLRQLGTTKLLVTGSATEYCVDTTVRAAASHDFDVIVVEDGHTTSDRSHLDAASIVDHHNEVWRGLILPDRSVRVASCRELIAELSQPSRAAADRASEHAANQAPDRSGYH